MVGKRIQISLSIFVAALLGSVVVLLAGHNSYAAGGSDNILSISPVRSDVTIAPGQSQKVQLFVTNITKAPITVSPVENDFVAGDEKGTPALILDADKYAPTHSLKKFMTPLDNVTIAPGKIALVEVIITVPKDAQAGGYFGAVRFMPAAGSDGGQVNLNASAASIILLNVPGNAVEKLKLTNFEVQQKGKAGTMFMTGKDIQIYTRLQNDGSVQEGPTGFIYVKNGDKIVYKEQFNNKDPKDMVLPDSARRWTVPLKNIDSFGHYTVGATFTYGKNNETIDVTTAFWVIPLWVMITAGGVLLALIALVIIIMLLIRRRKRRTSRRLGSNNFRR